MKCNMGLRVRRERFRQPRTDWSGHEHADQLIAAGRRGGSVCGVGRRRVGSRGSVRSGDGFVVCSQACRPARKTELKDTAANSVSGLFRVTHPPSDAASASGTNEGEARRPAPSSKAVVVSP